MENEAAFDPRPGVAEVLEPGLRRVLAPNPSPMTFRGTNTYLLGEGAVTVIDPGPAIPSHQAAILAALGRGERVARIIVTHAHLDHSALARPLAQATGAPVLAFGGPQAGRSAAMARLAAQGVIGGGEGVDAGFALDEVVAEGDAVEGAGWRLDVMHTPGHFGGHVCLNWGGRLFTGDHVMGWAGSLVSPPDGDMTDYMESLRRLAAGRWGALYPAHGAPVTDPAARIEALIAHRRAREAAILAAVRNGAATLPVVTAVVYGETPAALLPAAARNALAHLVDLCGRRMIVAAPQPGPEARYHAA